MSRCARCGKFFFFKKLTNGYCDPCKEKRIREIEAEQERLRREIAEQERIAAEAAENLRREEIRKKLSLPDKLNGLYAVYRYLDVDITPTPGAFDHPDFFPGMMVDAVPVQNVPDAPSEAAISLNGQIVGYLPKNRLAGMVVDWRRDNKPVLAALRTVDSDSGKVQIFLVFYDVRRFDKLLKKTPDAKTYRLTGNRNSEMQDNIFLCSVGDSCEIEYDDDKDKYLVTVNSLEIGYLPASARKAADMSDEVYIASVELDYDTDKYIVCVYIF